MTMSDRARPGRRPASRERGRPAAPHQALGERLLAMREQKGVDLYRAERDTKIRVRYLSALERGDYGELPGMVYTKGFLRNYALYLGLDPEEILEQYREEYGASRATEPVAIVPRTLEAPRGGLTFSRGVFVAVGLSVIVLLFLAYLAYQLLRFTQPPSLAIIEPAARVTTVDSSATQTVLAGTSGAGATVTIQGTGQQPYRVTADSTGHWKQEVPLTKGQNQFSVTATDPTTGKDSAAITLIITVPIPIIEAPTLSVTSPNDGAALTNGAIPVQGTTNATSITVSATLVGPVGPQPSKASPVPSATPAPKQIAVGPDGSFSDSYQLGPGRWSLTITATGSQGESTTETRSVTVAFTGVDLVVTIKNSPAWLKVWVDNVVDPAIGAGGQTFGVGRTVEFTAQHSVQVRTGSSGSTFFTLNGQSLGALGPPGVPQTWLFAPPAAPRQTNQQ
jgi:cytoskeletal protein RodZ